MTEGGKLAGTALSTQVLQLLQGKRPRPCGEKAFVHPAQRVCHTASTPGFPPGVVHASPTMPPTGRKHTASPLAGREAGVGAGGCHGLFLS